MFKDKRPCELSTLYFEKFNFVFIYLFIYLFLIWALIHLELPFWGKLLLVTVSTKFSPQHSQKALQLTVGLQP